MDEAIDERLYDVNSSDHRREEEQARRDDKLGGLERLFPLWASKLTPVVQEEIDGKSGDAPRDEERRAVITSGGLTNLDELILGRDWS